MTYQSGPGQYPDQWRGEGPWRAPGQDRSQDSAVWWILGIICLVGLALSLFAIVALTAFLVRLDSSEWTTAAEAPTATAPATQAAPATQTTPRSPSSAPPQRNSPSHDSPSRPDSFPEVRPAEDLPREDAGHLSTTVDASASMLRYRVMDMFDITVHNCLFSVDITNLTDEPISVLPTFRTVDAPYAEWDGGTPFDLLPGETTEQVLGWESEFPEDVTVPEEQCKGQVELTGLTVR